MDWIFFSSIQKTQLQKILVSYDIKCQWGQKLWSYRHGLLPARLQVNTDRLCVDTVIPKFHLQAHKPSCHFTYSLNFRVGVGHTDGEGIERDWSVLNHAASSTKEMSEGARHNALDNAWADWNYRKIVSLRESNRIYAALSCANNVYDIASFLLRKVLEANRQSELHAEQFATFCESLSADALSKWEEMAVLWEDDPKNPCPYVAESSRESVTYGSMVV